MKKKDCILFLLSLLAFCPACTYDVALEIDTVPPVLVLNASITSEREVAAFLSKSWFLLDSIPAYELPEEDVAISVYVNDLFRGVMQCADHPEDSLAYTGQFRLPGCYVQGGDKVRLEAKAKGFRPVSAETRIPAKTELIRLDTVGMISSGYNGNRLRLYLDLHDDPSVKNYYRLVVERLVEYRKGELVKWESSFFNDWFTTSSISGDLFQTGSFFSLLHLYYDDPVFQSAPFSLATYDGSYGHGVFSDELFNGKAYTLTSSFIVDHSFETDTMEVLVHYDIHLMSISEDYYNYLKIIRGISISLGDALLDGMEPTATYSNVIDGLGVVTGYQIETSRITMPLGEPPYSFTLSQ